MSAGGWPRASKGGPCPSCGHTRRCHVREDGGAVRCYWPEESNGWGFLHEEGEDGQGAYEVRYADAPARPSDSVAPARPARPTKTTKPASPAAAEIMTRTKVYGRLLELCPIPSDRLERLCADRSLSAAEVTERRLGYLPARGEWPRITAALVEEFGAEVLATVPGFRVGAAGVELSAAGSGFLIPYPEANPIDGGNLIGAVRLRLDDPAQGGKYRWMSGGGGPSVNQTPYLYRPDGAAAGKAVICEGEFKAIGAGKHFGAVAFGLPGVGQYRLGLTALAKLRVKKVIIAHDADQWENPQVARAVLSLVEELQAKSYEVTLAVWWEDLPTEETPKGIDDAIAAGVELRVIAGATLEDYCRELAAHHGFGEEDQGELKEEEDSGPLAALAALEPGCSIALLRPHLLETTKAAAKMSAMDRALLRAGLAQELKRLKVPGPSKLADAAIKDIEDATEDDEANLSETAPCEEEVNPAEVLAEVEAYLSRYISLPEGASTALALWVAHTYLIPTLTHSPRLAIQSPVKGCGKTTLMTLLAFLVEKPSPSASPSPAALFREVEAYAPTLLLDEVDAWIRDNEEIRGIINSGFFRPFAFVTRCDGDDHKVKRFKTFGAMALAGIDRLPPTIQDRSIVVSLRKKTSRDKVDRVIMTEALAEGKTMKPKLSRLATDIGEELERAASRAFTPPELEDRPSDLWRPLLAIADLAGDVWPVKAREAAVKLSDAGDDDDPSLMLIRDVYEAFDRRGVDAIRAEFLLDDLLGRPERPWKEFSRGRPLSANKLGRMLKGFGVQSRRIGSRSDQSRGYHKEDFADAFSRYIFFPDPPEKCVNASTKSAEPHNGEGSSVDRMVDALTDSQSKCVNAKTGPEEPVDAFEDRMRQSVNQSVNTETAWLRHSGGSVDALTHFSPPAKNKNNDSVNEPEPLLWSRGSL